jgi:hypothetical protein
METNPVLDKRDSETSNDHMKHLDCHHLVGTGLFTCHDLLERLFVNPTNRQQKAFSTGKAKNVYRM